jgi:peptidoglycan/LPS O-acetylase OafA/YrhL
MRISEKARNIPSLDGMRAISILVVIAAHSGGNFSHWIRIPPIYYLLLAHTGVSTFFVISGFLITSLLLKELAGTHTISLKRFYVRRAFRIFPPFYLYLGMMFALALFGAFHTPLRAFFFAAIYASNYYLGPGGGFLGLQHIWSLCVEEQFYLLWPAALLLMGKRKAAYLAGSLILISPLSRVITYLLLAPPHRAAVGRMFHTSIDTIMFGCLLALLWENDRFNRLVQPWANPWALAAAVSFLVLVDPLLDLSFRGGYSLVFGMMLEGISISVITLYVVRHPTTLSGRILNTSALRHIGLISYSLYLWQNILTGEADRYFPLNLAAILFCAEVSYWLVERPSLRLRDRLWKRTSADPAGVEPAVNGAEPDRTTSPVKLTLMS